MLEKHHELHAVIKFTFASTINWFKEIQDDFLAHIQAEIVMYEIKQELIFNWDLCLFQRSVDDAQGREKIIPIANSDDKC